MAEHVTMRQAVADDANELCSFGRKSFSLTFGHLYPTDELQAYLDESYTVEIIAGIIADPSCCTFIAFEENSTIAGYILLDKCSLPHADVTPHCLEVRRLYIRPSHFGKGTSDALMKQGLAWIESRICSSGSIWLGVYSENHRAQKFYARFGFDVVGEYEFIVGTCRDREFIMKLRK